MLWLSPGRLLHPQTPPGITLCSRSLLVYRFAPGGVFSENHATWWVALELWSVCVCGYFSLSESIIDHSPKNILPPALGYLLIVLRRLVLVKGPSLVSHWCGCSVMAGLKPPAFPSQAQRFGSLSCTLPPEGETDLEPAFTSWRMGCQPQHRADAVNC